MSPMGPEDSIEGVADVTRAYESAHFDEQPPAHVDRAILAAARRRRGPRLASFVPAFALAATVVLSFSLVLRSGMLGSGRVEAPVARDPVPATEVRQNNDRADQDSPRDDRELDTLSPGTGFVDAPQEEGLPSTPTLRRERALNEPAPAAIQESAQPDADPGAATTANFEAPSVQGPRASPTLEAEMEESSVLRSTVAGGTAEDCGTTSSGSPAEWLECISGQLARGSEDIARAELDTFAQTHPDYPLPERLQALREP